MRLHYPLSAEACNTNVKLKRGHFQQTMIHRWSGRTLWIKSWQSAVAVATTMWLRTVTYWSNLSGRIRILRISREPSRRRRMFKSSKPIQKTSAPAIAFISIFRRARRNKGHTSAYSQRTPRNIPGRTRIKEEIWFCSRPMQWNLIEQVINRCYLNNTRAIK